MSREQFTRSDNTVAMGFILCFSTNGGTRSVPQLCLFLRSPTILIISGASVLNQVSEFMLVIVLFFICWETDFF